MSIKPSDLYSDHSGVSVICALLAPAEPYLSRTASLTQQCLRVPCCAARELRTCIRLCKAHVLETQDVYEAEIRLSSQGNHAYPRSTNRPTLQPLLIAISVSATGTRAGQSNEPNMQDLPRGNSRPTYTSLNGSYQPGRVN